MKDFGRIPLQNGGRCARWRFKETTEAVKT